MAPTQVLAKQHYDSISKMLAPYGIRTAFLDSSLKKRERDEVLREIGNGSAQIIIGTHSCVGKDVVYKDLALAVVDEEHRFGVKQRTAIVEAQPGTGHIRRQYPAPYHPEHADRP